MERSLWAVILGTFTLRLSTGLTGTMLVYYLAELPAHGGMPVEPVVVGIFAATFYIAELALSPVFGPLADRFGYHRIMELGPAFGAIAVVLTGLTTNLYVLGVTRWLEGSSTAASVPSILGFIAIATAADEGLRGKAVARFEMATLAGLGAGLIIAGPLYAVFGPVAFFLNAGMYGVSWAIYRFGVHDPRADHGGRERRHRISLRRYWTILSGAHVWLLAPTWIAVNAAIGIWSAQGLFQFVSDPPPEFSDQFLLQGISPIVASIGIAAGGVVFFAGLVYWGNRFKALRRTTIIFYGILGGTTIVGGALAINHGGDLPVVALVPFAALVIGGLFVLAGATPAALGLLADMSEPYPDDRGAIMGLYSVFLALGQIGGSLLGGAAAEWKAIDGLLLASLLLMGIALAPLWWLRRYEHAVGGPRTAPSPAD
jgi:MFS family permease